MATKTRLIASTMKRALAKSLRAEHLALATQRDDAERRIAEMQVSAKALPALRLGRAEKCRGWHPLSEAPKGARAGDWYVATVPLAGRWTRSFLMQCRGSKKHGKSLWVVTSADLRAESKGRSMRRAWLPQKG